MNWQEYAVAAIGIFITVLAVVRIVNAIKKRKAYNPCANCPQTDCKLKELRGSECEKDEHLSR